MERFKIFPEYVALITSKGSCRRGAVRVMVSFHVDVCVCVCVCVCACLHHACMYKLDLEIHFNSFIFICLNYN